MRTPRPKTTVKPTPFAAIVENADLLGEVSPVAFLRNRCGFASSNASRIINRTSDPHWSTCARILRALGYTLRDQHDRPGPLGQLTPVGKEPPS